ncbi:MAG: peptidase U32 family protein [Helicobacter sp.]|nr:U32 family peptidase [Helicobacteraceae bacterium]MDY3113986.1 peptidase U32 family protein [Helicobacter sp.]
MIKPELLSPAGNLKKLKIALEYGADAVYGGVSHFSLRNRSGKEFDFDSFKEGVEYTHNKGKKIYVTINGFPFNSQLKLLESHIEKMASLKPDGFIVAAPGVIKLARKIAPEIPIHLSTQANVLNVLDAQVFYEMGVKRIVAARELSLKDAIEIKKALPELELEIFIHGSMCFAFSGRCLISALQSGRVPNRGSCANDCRFDYEYFVRDLDSDKLVRFDGREFYAKNPDNGVMMRLQEESGVGTHIFNSKDLNLCEHIPLILESGVIDSLKIEGRTKSSYYAGITALAYRAAIDDYFSGNFNVESYKNELDTLKNRGFSDGYLIHRPYQKLNTQNHFTAISEGSFQVNAEVSENGKTALCRHTIRLNEAKEIVSANVESLVDAKNEIGEIFTFEGKKYIRFFKILLENGKELESIHSGNTNAFILPFTLPPFSFLRQRV